MEKSNAAKDEWVAKKRLIEKYLHGVGRTREEKIFPFSLADLIYYFIRKDKDTLKLFNNVIKLVLKKEKYKGRQIINIKAKNITNPVKYYIDDMRTLWR